MRQEKSGCSGDPGSKKEKKGMVYDLLYKKGEHDGRALWVRCGVLIEKGNGKMSVKLDTVPVSGQWDGWLVVSERREWDRDGGSGRGGTKRLSGMGDTPPAGYDDLPF